MAAAEDSRDLGAPSLAGTATNAQDSPRTTTDTAANEIVTGTGDALPSQVDSKRLHAVPGGVTHDPFAKGSTRMTEHKKQQSQFVVGASDGPQTGRAPGEEDLDEEQAMDNLERRE